MKNALSELEVDYSSESPVRTLAIISIVAVIALFYAILCAELINVPREDDYAVLLNLANQLSQTHGFVEGAKLLLFTQHNEYKLAFENAVIWLQYSMLGHVSIPILCLIGNTFVLFLGWILWKMFLPEEISSTRRLLLFLPAVFLLFQLNDVENLDWVTSCLQNLPVLVFSLASIYYIARRSWKDFAVGSLCLALAIASSGNGFIVIPVGMMLLIWERQLVRTILWLAVSGCCGGLYFYHYNRFTSQSPKTHSIFLTLLHIKPAFIVAFMGAAGWFPVKVGTLILGAAICMALIWLNRKGYFRRRRVIAACVLFLVLCSIGVAGLRSDFGMYYSTSSRYRIYSDLFLIFIWFGVAEEYPWPSGLQVFRSRLFLTVCAVTGLFCLSMDAYGFMALRYHNKREILGMAAYEHPEQYPGVQEPVVAPPDLPEELRDTFDKGEIRARQILDEAVKRGTYIPPAL